MYECEECEGDSNHSRYHIPVIDKDGTKKILHLECCSKESLLKLLQQKVESELLFYKNVEALINDLNLDNLENFEQKYGTYDEVRNWMQIDRFMEISAIVDQIKKKLQ